MNFDIAMLFERLFGNIQPLCDQNIDTQRYENIVYYEEALEFISNELIECAKWKNDNRYSANRIGEKAYKILKNINKNIDYELSYIDEQEEANNE